MQNTEEAIVIVEKVTEVKHQKPRSENAKFSAAWQNVFGGGEKKDVNPSAEPALTPVPVITTTRPYPYYSTYYNNGCDSTLQVSHQTKVNRFPKIFETVKNLKPNPARILSYGCSTGEECFTLAEQYPNSEIVGIDIDHYTIVQARKNNKYPDRVFFHDTLGATGKYDLILCLMVLFSLNEPIPEENFKKALLSVDKHVNPEGLLAIYTAEYDPINTLMGYKPLKEWTRIHNTNNKSYFNGYYVKV